MRVCNTCMHASILATGGVDTSTDAVAADLGLADEARARVLQPGLLRRHRGGGHHLHPDEVPVPASATPRSRSRSARCPTTLGLSGPAISRAVDGLVQRGEVKRTEDPRDRRSKLLTVSARGRRTVDRFVAIRLAAVKRFVEGLSEAEREALAAGVGPIARRLDS